MQHERPRGLSIQGSQDRVEVLRAFGQGENFATLLVGITNFGGNGNRYQNMTLLAEQKKELLRLAA